MLKLSLQTVTINKKNEWLFCKLRGDPNKSISNSDSHNKARLKNTVLLTSVAIFLTKGNEKKERKLPRQKQHGSTLYLSPQDTLWHNSADPKVICFQQAQISMRVVP